MSTWHLSKLIFKIETSAAVTAQFDEQWRLIQARDHREALHKAHQLGRALQDEDSNSSQLSQWRFVTVAELFEFGDNLRDGSELFSRIAEPDNEHHYLSTVRAHSEQLELRTEPLLFATT